MGGLINKRAQPKPTTRRGRGGHRSRKPRGGPSAGFLGLSAHAHKGETPQRPSKRNGTRIKNWRRQKTEQYFGSFFVVLCCVCVVAAASACQPVLHPWIGSLSLARPPSHKNSRGRKPTSRRRPIALLPHTHKRYGTYTNFIHAFGFVFPLPSPVLPPQFPPAAAAPSIVHNSIKRPPLHPPPTNAPSRYDPPPSPSHHGRENSRPSNL